MAGFSPDGLQMLKNLEGLRLRAYKDVVGIWTIGYGHTGTDVYPGQVITEAEAGRLLKNDVFRFEMGVQNSLRRLATPEQFDAMVSLAYNIGLAGFKRSSVLSRFNYGDYHGAAKAFALWCRAGREIRMGLVLRRATEIIRFMTG